MRPWLRAGWTPWCAAVLLALLAVSMLHAAVPHGGGQRDCSTCKALSSPGLEHEQGDTGRPIGLPSEIHALPPPGPLRTLARCLKPLRAPPESPVA